MKITKLDENKFRVDIDLNRSSTSHEVTLNDDYWQKLTAGKISKEELIEKSFEFLLERESNETILREFELPVINQYFPEFEDSIQLK